MISLIDTFVHYHSNTFFRRYKYDLVDSAYFVHSIYKFEFDYGVFS